MNDYDRLRKAHIESLRRKPLRPFFGYMGSKWRIARLYPEPRYKTIVEPFAGAAGYSHWYPNLEIQLCDMDPVICGIWDYLIHVKQKELDKLPWPVSDIRELKVCQEAKWLIGYWINGNHGKNFHRITIGEYGKTKRAVEQGWGPAVIDRIAGQVEFIRHWKIKHGWYEELDNREATWFVDPPYHSSGVYYREHLIHYGELSEWCRSLKGQAIVCEQQGAKWLPFKRLNGFKTFSKWTGDGLKDYKGEVVWYNELQ